MYKKISIKNFDCLAYIGVYESEKQNKQRIRINVDILLHSNIKTKTDKLNDVADYGKFRRLIIKIVSAKHYNLIETLAETIFSKLKSLEKVQNVRVEIIKLEAFDDCEVSYEIKNYL